MRQAEGITNRRLDAHFSRLRFSDAGTQTGVNGLQHFLCDGPRWDHWILSFHGWLFLFARLTATAAAIIPAAKSRQ